MWRSVFLVLAHAKPQTVSVDLFDVQPPHIDQRRCLCDCLPQDLVDDLYNLDSFTTDGADLLPLSKHTSGTADVLGEVDRLSNAVLAWRQSLNIRAIAAKDTSFYLQHQVQPLLQVWDDAMPAAKRVFQTHQQHLHDTESKLNEMIENAQVLDDGLVASAKANIVQETKGALKRVAKMNMRVQYRLDAMAEGQMRLTQLAGGLEAAVEHLTDRIVQCREHDKTACNAFTRVTERPGGFWSL